MDCRTCNIPDVNCYEQCRQVGACKRIASEVRQYISSLHEMDIEEAKKISCNSLIRSGILFENGRSKATISNGNFFE